jgi:hypothetical protein
MIRSSKHILKYSNINKINWIDRFFIDYKSELEYYISLFQNNKILLNKFTDTSNLGQNIRHSGWKQNICKQAPELKLEGKEIGIDIGIEMDADFNAAKNILHLGFYRPQASFT